VRLQLRVRNGWVGADLRPRCRVDARPLDKLPLQNRPNLSSVLQPTTWRRPEISPFPRGGMPPTGLEGATVGVERTVSLAHRFDGRDSPS
jgi:hypothetical protein